ncbi:MAG: hypothetical protein EZS28_036394 [Streblomastix strix]|uniref:Uncharacterized protein n=1 Tax=Streblomastix strix TaxID=222440 RepID=A0A5J4UBY5_9EUKA|nr:MAG: hypothetical protein EZS28_036394 [Streblomastix strix]
MSTLTPSLRYPVWQLIVSTIYWVQKPLMNIQTLVYGFSANEILYKWDDKRKQVMVKGFANIPNATLDNGLNSFVFNSEGDITAVRQSPSGFSSDNDIIIPFDKVIMFTYRDEGGNILGRPLSEELNNVIQQRQMLLDNLRVFINRHINPIITSHSEMVTPETRSQLSEFMRDVLEGRFPALTMGEKDKLSLLETKNKADGFLATEEVYSRIILRICKLSQQAESKYGNYSAKEIDVFPKFSINEITESNLDKLIYLVNSSPIDTSESDCKEEQLGSSEGTQAIGRNPMTEGSDATDKKNAQTKNANQSQVPSNSPTSSDIDRAIGNQTLFLFQWFITCWTQFRYIV